MAIGLALLELSSFAQPGEDPLVRLGLGQTRELAGFLVHQAVGTDHGQLGQSVVAADLVVLRIVARCDLQRPGAEVHLDALVCDHRHPPLDPGNDHVPADGRRIPLVLRVNSDRDVGEDRRRPDGRDRHVPVSLGERIADVGERVVHVDVRHLEIRQRRQMEWAPVDDPVGAVDPTLVPQVDEEAHHRAHVGLVHREPLAAVVERRADAPELHHDLAAVLVQPFPDARLEGFAAEILARLPFGREVLLDRVLRRDAGMVIARLEEDVVALHPPRPDDRVRERELERVPEVQVTGHIRRRMRDREALPRWVRIGVVETFGLPRLLPALLDPLRFVARLHLLTHRLAILRRRRRSTRRPRVKVR